MNDNKDENLGLCWGGFFLHFIWATYHKIKAGYIIFNMLVGLLILFAGMFLFPDSSGGLLLVFLFSFYAVILFGIFPLSVYLLFKGHEYALKNREWKNIDHYKKIQKKWSIFGILFNVALITLIFFSAVTNFKRMSLKSKNSEARLMLSQLYSHKRDYFIEHSTYQEAEIALDFDSNY